MKQSITFEDFRHGIEATIEQGQPCVDGDGECVYVNADGLRCVVGHMLDEPEAVTAELDAAGLVNAGEVVLDGVGREALVLAQNIHDWRAFSGVFHVRMLGVGPRIAKLPEKEAALLRRFLRAWR
ncbi:MAG: hypothetical protein AAFV36_09035 [Myxococcota bacterium]